MYSTDAKRPKTFLCRHLETEPRPLQRGFAAISLAV